MNFSSFATEDSPNLVDAERLSRAKPVLFLHIPKTGGSSFLTALGNVFGERRVRRLRHAEEMTQAQIDRIVSDEIQHIDCLVGHFPTTGQDLHQTDSGVVYRCGAFSLR